VPEPIAPSKVAANRKLAAMTRKDPLAPLEDYLVLTVGPASEDRVRHSVTILEHALAIRDASQHADAGSRLVPVLDALGVGYPIVDVTQAWLIVTTRVIEALVAIREELASASQ
jgi:hypothetical protein